MCPIHPYVSFVNFRELTARGRTPYNNLTTLLLIASINAALVKHGLPIHRRACISRQLLAHHVLDVYYNISRLDLTCILGIYVIGASLRFLLETPVM